MGAVVTTSVPSLAGVSFPPTHPNLYPTFLSTLLVVQYTIHSLIEPPFIHIGSDLAFYELLINSFDHQQYGNDLLYFVWADQSRDSAVFVVIIYFPVVTVTKFIPWVPHFYHENYSIHYNSPIWEISFHANRQSGNCSVGYCWLRNTKQSIVRWIAIQWCCDGLACNGLWTTAQVHVALLGNLPSNIQLFITKFLNYRRDSSSALQTLHSLFTSLYMHDWRVKRTLLVVLTLNQAPTHNYKCVQRLHT